MVDKTVQMLEYYKLVLVRAGEDRSKFRQEVRRALVDLDDPEAKEALKKWFKNRSNAPRLLRYDLVFEAHPIIKSEWIGVMFSVAFDH